MTARRQYNTSIILRLKNEKSHGRFVTKRYGWNYTVKNLYNLRLFFGHTFRINIRVYIHIIFL